MYSSFTSLIWLSPENTHPRYLRTEGGASEPRTQHGMVAAGDLFTFCCFIFKSSGTKEARFLALKQCREPVLFYLNLSWGLFFFKITTDLTCLLRNLYAGQEATVRTRHGTTHWFQIGKGKHEAIKRKTTNKWINKTNWERSTSKLYIITLLI